LNRVIDDGDHWLSDDEQRTWRAFVVAAHEVESALDRQLLRDCGMPHAYYGILVILSEAEGRMMRMGDLAGRLHYSKSRLTHAITRMEETGWVRRDRCPTDRRGQIAVLTPQGSHELAQAAPAHVAEVRRRILDPLSPSEQRTLGRLLQRIIDASQA
jgi:DNA-binding MarR family transcriptional regulator